MEASSGVVCGVAGDRCAVPVCDLAAITREVSVGRSGASALGRVRAMSGLVDLPKVQVNQNLLPLPGSLSNPISPPSNSTNSLEIASPSPVPPYLRVFDS